MADHGRDRSAHRPVGFTASIGITFAERLSGAAPQVNALLREADALLYRAKDNGRDRIEVPPAAEAQRSPSGG